jgi:hypothetical protein
MRKLGVVLLAGACAHAPPPRAPVALTLGTQNESYLAADELRTFSLESPGGHLLVTCRMTGEGAYARIEVRHGADVIGRGTCGDRIRIVDAPAGALSIAARVYGGPGSLRLVADQAQVDPTNVEVPSGDPPEAALATALRAGDEAALDGLLMDDFSVTLGGKPLDKRGYLEAVARDRSIASEPRDVRTRVHGQTALVTSAVGSATVTDTWVSDGGRWRLLARQQ